MENLRPPKVHRSYDGSHQRFEFNESTSVRFEDACQAFKIMQAEGLIPAKAKIHFKLPSGRIAIQVPRPTHIINRRSKHFEPWVTDLERLVKVMVISVQVLWHRRLLHSPLTLRDEVLYRVADRAGS